MMPTIVTRKIVTSLFSFRLSGPRPACRTCKPAPVTAQYEPFRLSQRFHGALAVVYTKRWLREISVRSSWPFIFVRGQPPHPNRAQCKRQVGQVACFAARRAIAFESRPRCMRHFRSRGVRCHFRVANLDAIAWLIPLGGYLPNSSLHLALCVVGFRL